MMALEDTYFSMGEKCNQNVLIICDRGVMDASAFIEKEAWDKILNKLSLEDIEISDNRYNHIVHMQVDNNRIYIQSMSEHACVNSTSLVNFRALQSVRRSFTLQRTIQRGILSRDFV